MDGYEVAARMRREEWCKDAVIVAVSGYGQDEDRRRSTEAGFDHHLIKPLDHDAPALVDLARRKPLSLSGRPRPWAYPQRSAWPVAVRTARGAKRRIMWRYAAS